jgi:hypothetical protein
MMEITQPIFSKIQEIRQLSKKTKDYYLICDQETDIYVVTFVDNDTFKEHIYLNSEYSKLPHLAYIYDGQYYPLK